MSRLAIGFVVRMGKQATGFKGETTPIFDGKLPKLSSPNEEAHKDWAIISVDSTDRASNYQPISEGTLNEAYAPLGRGSQLRGLLMSPKFEIKPHQG